MSVTFSLSYRYDPDIEYIRRDAQHPYGDFLVVSAAAYPPDAFFSICDAYYGGEDAVKALGVARFSINFLDYLSDYFAWLTAADPTRAMASVKTLDENWGAVIDRRSLATLGALASGFAAVFAAGPAAFELHGPMLEIDDAPAQPSRVRFERDEVVANLRELARMAAAVEADPSLYLLYMKP